MVVRDALITDGRWTLDLRTRSCKILPVSVVAAILLCPSSLYSQSKRFEEFVVTPPLVGEVAPDFTLQTVDGEKFTLSEAYAKQPVVIEFGSYT
jgi:hypothetical protein